MPSSLLAVRSLGRNSDETNDSSLFRPVSSTRFLTTALSASRCRLSSAANNLHRLQPSCLAYVHPRHTSLPTVERRRADHRANGKILPPLLPPPCFRIPMTGPFSLILASQKPYERTPYPIGRTCWGSSRGHTWVCIWAPCRLPARCAFSQLPRVCSTKPIARATDAGLWPNSTSRTASCLNSSVYRPLRLRHLRFPSHYNRSLRDTFCGDKVSHLRLEGRCVVPTGTSAHSIASPRPS